LPRPPVRSARRNGPASCRASTAPTWRVLSAIVLLLVQNLIASQVQLRLLLRRRPALSRARLRIKKATQLARSFVYCPRAVLPDNSKHLGNDLDSWAADLERFIK
jgi:hypothetical protein